MFHKRFFTFLLHSKIDTSSFKSVLQTAQRDHLKTWEIPQAFFRSWLNKDIRPLDKSTVSEETLRYGAIWMALHMATLILNATSRTEKENLIREFNLERIKVNEIEGIQYQSRDLGAITIIRGMAHISRIRSIVDRNMLLLMKDVVNSRVHCLMSMQNRHDTKYTSPEIFLMERVYQIGDEMIIKNGNRAYDGLKLIEPICNLRMTELAQKERAKIPLFTEFKEHIIKSVDDSQENKTEHCYEEDVGHI